MFNRAKFGKDKSISKVMSFVRKYIESGGTLFRGAFIFKESKEGHEYWAELCEKWKKKTN